MRIVFFGTPEFALPSLQALLQSRFDVAGVVTQPDKPQGRSRSQLVPPPVKVVAQSEGVPTLQPVRPIGDVFTASQPEASRRVVTKVTSVDRQRGVHTPPREPT